jgi:hypothetical protein
MAVLLVPPFQYFADDDGNPLSGGKIFTYQAGTTTPKATYSDAGGTIPLANPVILDSAGRTVMFGSGSYKFIVKDANDTTIRTVDGVVTYNTNADSSTPFFQSFSGNGSTTSFTLSQDLGTEEKALMIFVNKGLQECVTNGNFATDTDWTKGAGWTIGAGVATAAGAISTAISQTSAVTLVAGTAYSVTYTITRSAGGLIPSLGGQNGTERTASGTYRETIVAGSSQTIAFTGNGFTGTLDAISITVAASAGFDIQNPSAYTVNGTSLTFTTAPATGTDNIFVFAPSTLVGAAAASAASADASATAAAASASTASTAATSATASAATALAAAYFGTSTTSVAIGTGAKSFTTQTAKNFQVGGFLLISSQADGANYMHGQVTSYNSGTGALVMDITNVGGSGTFADWNIYVSGTRGATGAPGGPLTDGDYGDVTVSAIGTVITVDGSSAADFLTNSVRTTGSSGVAIKNSAGNSVATIGPAGTLNTSFAGKVNTAATTASAAGINIPHGTGPSSPVDGDFWSTTSGFFGRVNGGTVPLSGSYAVGSFTCPGSTGSNATTGVGFRPRYIELFSINMSTNALYAVGFGGGVVGSTRSWGLAQTGSTSNSTASVTTNALQAITAGSASVVVQATLTSFDADGFTLNFTAVSTAHTIVWRAYA